MLPVHRCVKHYDACPTYILQQQQSESQHMRPDGPLRAFHACIVASASNSIELTSSDEEVAEEASKANQSSLPKQVGLAQY